MRRYKGKVYSTHLLRRTFRQDGRVQHETLGNISHLPPDVIAMIRGALRGEHYVVADHALEIRRSLPHGHVAAVLGTLRKVGLDRLIASRRCVERDLAVAMIASRILDPASKLATARSLHADTASSSLGQQLGVEAVDEADLYAAMDWLVQRQARIETKLAHRHLDEGCLVLYDLSSSYYTGTHCPLAQFGHSRDRKTGFPQIEYGLLCNRDGCPVAVEVFAGNVGDPTTLGPQLQKIRARFRIRHVVVVGDRGMITSARIRDELKPVEGLDWITALRAPAIRKLAEAGIVQPSLFDDRDLAEIHAPEYPGERLIACRNPLLAAERTRKREVLLQATEKELDTIVAATRRRQRALTGQDRIALRVGKLINRHKMAKHFHLAITDTSFAYQRHAEQIAAEAALDGIYIIRTSVSEHHFDAEAAVQAYKDLAVVEHAFRSLKTVDLKVRPIHHRLEDRVRAHVFLCMLAYYVEWHMRRSLSPMLFDDEDRDLARTLRRSVVAPAVRSPGAARKARTKRTAANEPVHSFQTLLHDLATLATNRMRPQMVAGSTQPVEFDLLTTPTNLQRRAFELLEVRLTL
ncbi:MAG: IS1634 family transposase [Acidobacteria bacterium]|nr:IS1634 family transposase [Acidobacteriota bacterium]